MKDWKRAAEVVQGKEGNLLELCYVFLHGFHSLLELGRGLPSLLAAPAEVSDGAGEVVLPLRGSGVQILWAPPAPSPPQKRPQTSTQTFLLSLRFKAEHHLVG